MKKNIIIFAIILLGLSTGQAQNSKTNKSYTHTKKGGSFYSVVKDKYVINTPEYYEVSQTHDDGGISTLVKPDTNNTASTRLEELEVENNSTMVSIFPNPASTAFTLETRFENTQEVLTISILNSYGKPVKTMDGIKAKDQVNVDIHDIPAGIYYYVLKSGGKVLSSGKVEVN